MPPRTSSPDSLADTLIDLNALIARYEERRDSGKLNPAEVKAYNREIDKAKAKIAELQPAA